MQANKVLGVRGGLGELGDGDSGRVGGEDSVVYQLRFSFLGYPGFQFAVFKDGFDYQIAAFQIIRRIRGFDAPEDLCLLRFAHPATADFLGQQFLGVALAFFGVLHGDIFQHHVDSPRGCGIGNTCAHHAGAKHANLAEGFFLDAIGPAAARLDGVQLEPEGAGHVLGDLADHQLGKIPGLDQATVVEIHLGSLDGRGENAFRRRIAAFGFLLQHGRCDGQFLGHGGMVRRPARKLEAFLVPRLMTLGIGIDECPGLGDHVVGRIGQFVDNTSLQCGFGVHLFAFHQKREGCLKANHPGQSLGSATAGKQAQRHLRQAQLNADVVNRHAMVAGQGDLQTTAQGRAVDSGHHGFAGGFEEAHVGFQAVDHVLKGFGVGLCDLVQLCQIAAGKEGFFG